MPVYLLLGRATAASTRASIPPGDELRRDPRQFTSGGGVPRLDGEPGDDQNQQAAMINDAQ